MGYRKNVTYIKDLPDVEEFEHPKAPRPFTKAIRDTRYRNPYDEMIHSRQDRPQHAMRRPPPGMGMPPPGIEHGMHMHSAPLRENYDTPPPTKCICEINCIDVNEHIKGCPICSRFYNTDLTIYIIVIVFLSIICLILLKKVLKI